MARRRSRAAHRLRQHREPSARTIYRPRARARRSSGPRSQRASASFASSLPKASILALAGGALGIAFAAAANRLLLRMVSDGFRRIRASRCLAQSAPSRLLLRRHHLHSRSLRHASRTAHHSPRARPTALKRRSRRLHRHRAKSTRQSPRRLAGRVIARASGRRRTLPAQPRQPQQRRYRLQQGGVLRLQIDSDLHRLQRRRSTHDRALSADRAARQLPSRSQMRQLLLLRLR